MTWLFIFRVSSPEIDMFGALFEGTRRKGRDIFLYFSQVTVPYGGCRYKQESTGNVFALFHVIGTEFRCKSRNGAVIVLGGN